DKAAQVGDPLLEDLARVERPALEPQPAFQLVPDPVVGPPRKVLVRPDLEVEPRERRRAHAVQRETAFAVGVDQLVVGRRGRGQNAEPTEGKHATEGRQDGGGKGAPRNALKPAPAGNKSQPPSTSSPSARKRIAGGSDSSSCTLTPSTSKWSGR